MLVSEIEIHEFLGCLLNQESSLIKRGEHIKKISFFRRDQIISSLTAN